MNSSMIGKIEKAKRYAEEPERFHFSQFSTEVRGANDNHTVTFGEHGWHCTCHFFEGWGACCHTMALQRLLGVMLPEEHRAEDDRHLAVSAS